MPLALPALHGSIGAPPLRLVGPGMLSSLLSVARAQVNARATSLGADGATWQEHVADAARFHGTARRLLCAGQRTNAIRNPRAEGVAAGSTGLPTHWQQTGPGLGLSRQIVGTGTEDGIPYVDIRFAGAASSTGSCQLSFETTTGTAASAGQAWTLSAFLRLVASAGAMPGFSLSGVWRDGAGSALASSSSDTVTVSNSVSLGRQRHSHAYTIPGSATSTASTSGEVSFSVTSGAAYDFTLRIGAPQLELGTFATTPILPPEGAPQATTRGTDLITSPSATLFPNGKGTILWSGIVPQAAPTGVEQLILQVSGATDANKISLRVASGSSNVQITRATGGAGMVTTIGSLTIGSPFAAGVTFDGTGSVRAYMSGGPVGGVTGAPTSFSQFRLGTNSSGAAAMFGETSRLEVFPFALSDAALAVRVNLVPL